MNVTLSGVCEFCTMLNSRHEDGVIVTIHSAGRCQWFPTTVQVDLNWGRWLTDGYWEGTNCWTAREVEVGERVVVIGDDGELMWATVTAVVLSQRSDRRFDVTVVIDPAPQIASPRADAEGDAPVATRRPSLRAATDNRQEGES